MMSLDFSGFQSRANHWFLYGPLVIALWAHIPLWSRWLWTDHNYSCCTFQNVHAFCLSVHVLSAFSWCKCWMENSQFKWKSDKRQFFFWWNESVMTHLWFSIVRRGAALTYLAMQGNLVTLKDVGNFTGLYCSWKSGRSTKQHNEPFRGEKNNQIKKRALELKGEQISLLNVRLWVD